MANYVQQYRSTDANSPVLSGTAGSLIALLDACLVNGYTTASVTSITEASTTYTVIIAVANTTLVTGDNVTISGASPAGANGTWKITVTDSTHFTYVGPGGLGTITGTILYKKAGAQWTKPFTAANRAAFLTGGSAPYTNMYMRVEEDGNSAGGQKEAVVTGFETMSDVNTGGAQFPTSAQVAISGTATKAGVFWRKSTTADATARPWTIFADNRFVYLLTNSEASLILGRCWQAFGSFESYKTSDAYNVCISGPSIPATATAAISSSGLMEVATWNGGLIGAGFYVARTYAQTGGSVPVNSVTGNAQASTLGGTVGWGMPFPNGPDSGLWVTPVLVAEFPTSIMHVRGRLPGLYSHMHTGIPANEYDTVTGVVGLSGVTLTAVQAITTSGTNAISLVDTFGPW